MNKLTFQQKLWIPLICSLITITSIFAYDSFELRQARTEERLNEIASVDDAALGIVKHFGDLAQSGAMDKETAQKQAMAAVGSMRYGRGNSGYVAINTAQGISMMNPVKPENNGKSVNDLKDVNGVYVYREIIAAAKSPSGKGYASYHWPRPGSTESFPKTARVVSYTPWDWQIVTGVYTDDIDSAFYASLTKSGVVLGIVCVVLSLIVTVINRSLQRTLGGAPEYASEVASKISSGDLSGTVATKPDDNESVLFAMKTMQKNLARTIGEIRQSADTIATASGQIAAGNMDLSERTETQASSLEETAASMEELTSAVNQNAENAAQANLLAQSASETAQRGGAVVSQVVNTMGAINASASKIVDIIGVIDSIAFQTNILALNAAVEAARAGEEGKGFAVVASEVRNLAHRSAAAAKEIKELIGDSVQCIEVGTGLVDQAGKSMEEIVASVSRVTQIMSAITAASSEQSTGISHVGQAISEMDSVTQKNAALVEEAAAAAGAMQDQASNLASLVSRFQLDASSREQGESLATIPSQRVVLSFEQRKPNKPSRIPTRVRSLGTA